MAAPVEVNVSRIIDQSKIGSFQIGIYALCFACLMMDGFDVQALGYVAPALSEELNISRVQLGPVLSAAPLGVLIGSIFCSMLADKIGRRPVLIGSTIFFSLLTYMTARATSLEELRIIRVIGGIGMGAIMPNAMALVGEYSPKRSRVTVMMIVSNGFTAGAALGGFLAAWMLPLWGWRSVFYFGAAVPLVISAVMIAVLPESIQFLTLQGKRMVKAAAWLRRIDPRVPAAEGARFFLEDDSPGGGETKRMKGNPFLALLQDGRAMGTLLIWVINFMNLLNLYFLQGWITTVLADAGIDPSTAAIIAAMVQVGGTIGALTLGFSVHKWGFVPVLVACSVLASLNIALIGQPWASVPLLFVCVFIAGFAVVGGQASINALSGTYYPTELRSTGLGAGLGVGRIGAIVGPTLASVMIAAGWSAAQIFYAAAIPPLVIAAAMLSWKRLAKPPQGATAGAEKVLAH